MSGCGAEFYDPDALRKASLEMLRAELISVADDPRLYFHLEFAGQDSAFETIRVAIDNRVIPRSRLQISPCNSLQGTCVQAILDEGAEAATVSAYFPDFDVRVQRPLSTVRVGPYELDAEALLGNTEARVLFRSDPVQQHLGGSLFHRGYELALRRGACGAPFEEQAWQSVRQLPLDVPVVFDENELACVGVRPIVPKKGPEVAQITFSARALVRSYRHLFTPPVVAEPLVYAILFDLEIPNEERCLQTQTTLEQMVSEVGRAVSEVNPQRPRVVALPSVQIAELDGVRCRQTNERRLFSDLVSQNLASAIQAELGPDAVVRPVLLYVANLPLVPPPDLRESLSDLVERLGPRPGIPAYFVAAAPESVVQSLASVNGELAWTSALETEFRNRLESVLSEAWPFFRTLTSGLAEIPLTDELSLEGLVAWRVCSAPPVVQPIGDAVGQLTYLVSASSPPAFRAFLTPQLWVPSSLLVQNVLEVRWEGCYGLCDRPAPGGSTEVSWLTQESCQ